MKYKRSTILPIILLIYLAVMSYIGFDYFRAGHYLYYFGIIGCTLAIIIILHFNLKRRETLRDERNEDIKKRKDAEYGRYNDHEK